LRPPAEVAARGFASDEMAIVEPLRRKALVGTPAQVAQQMRELAAELGLAELVVNTWAHDPAVRRKSYALLAREFGLQGGLDGGLHDGSQDAAAPSRAAAAAQQETCANA
jgi:hypothetical protein